MDMMLSADVLFFARRHQVGDAACLQTHIGSHRSWLALHAARPALRSSKRTMRRARRYQALERPPTGGAPGRSSSATPDPVLADPVPPPCCSRSAHRVPRWLLGDFF